jgi:hypothetical protein
MDRWLNIFNEDQLKIIRERSTRLLNEVEKKEKSLGWKVRARVGPKKVWYKEVDELDRLPEEI